MVKEEGNLASFFPQEWFDDRSAASGWMRIYSCLVLSREQFDSFGEKISAAAEDLSGDREMAEPVKVGFGSLDGLKYQDLGAIQYADPDTGMTTIKIEGGERVLPDSNYVLLGAPYRGARSVWTEGAVRTRLDVVAAVITLHLGLNFMRDIMWEGEVEIGADKIHFPGPPMAVPQAAEGPFVALQNWKDHQEISARIRRCLEPKKGRIRLALGLMDEGMRVSYGFFQYWTALVVLVNGRAGTIKSRLAKLYKIPSHAVLAESSGLKTLSDWRHGFFHEGVRPPLSADVERYIHLLFLDLLRQELDLEPRYYVASLLKAPGYDLSPLGLEDQRTDEQKEEIRKAREHWGL